MEDKRRTIGIIAQVALFFAFAVALIGVMAFYSQQARAERVVKQQIETRATHIVDDVSMTIRDYPSYEWLLRYWSTHDKEMDIEYDANFHGGTKTEEKTRRLEEDHPGLSLRYASEEEIEALSEEDQKLFAEIAYSWIIDSLDQIKLAHNVDYLFVVLTGPPYDYQYFLLSAADPDSVRGTEYLQVYPLGVKVSLETTSQQLAMELARKNNAHLADAGDYIDYYAFLATVDGQTALIGVTYNLEDLMAQVSGYARNGTLLAILYQLCMAAIVLLMLYRFLLRPLKRIQRSIRRYKETIDSESAIQELEQVRPRNEMGVLSKDVAELAREMDDYLHRIRAITAEKERMNTELDVASKIQEGSIPHIFPAFPERKEFELYASMNTAKEVGGDFYDYFLVDDDHLVLVMADVSGKGIPAALFMMSSKIMLNNYSLTGDLDPAKILADVNDQLCVNNTAEMFVTVWMGILELSSGKLRAANAGHEYPALKRRDGRYELYEDPHGFVLGGMEGMVYKDYEIQLRPGDMLYQYTDGVTEATNGEDELFGTDRMLASLNREPADPEQALRNMTKDIGDFVQEAPQFDDITMLCLRYDGPQAGNEETQPQA